jgi:hypothetical protein
MPVIALALVILVVETPRAALAQQPSVAAVSIKTIAEQLGAKAQPRDDDDLNVGTSFTSMLTDPQKIAAFGIKGMHEGARVTVARIAPDKVRVEVDEMEPAPVRASATIKLDAKGALTGVLKSS